MPDGALSLPDAAQVAAYLRAHPRFLADHPELYRALTPPARVHGAELADHMAAMIVAERAHATAMSDQAESVLAAGRAAAGLSARVQEAVLALMRSDEPALCVTDEFPSLLAVDAVSLCIEAELAGWRCLPAGTVDGLLGGRPVVFGCACHAAAVHGEATPLARHDALIRIPMAGPPALLALASRDKAVLDPAQGSAALAFLGRAVATVLTR